MRLSSISVKQFKCLDDFALPLRSLTLLTGHNAAGKSSSIQPLLLLAQAAQAAPYADSFDLNGRLIRVGNASDAIYSNANTRLIDFRLTTVEPLLDVKWAFEVPETSGARNLRALAVDVASVSEPKTYAKTVFADDPNLRAIRNCVGNIVYLGAARTGPLEAYPVPDSVNIYADVGIDGRHAPWWYAQFADEDIDVSRRHPAEEGFTLRRQLDAYFNDLFRGGQANAELIQRTALCRLAFRMSNTSAWLRPINVGFGLSYAFPLLVTLLLAKKDQVIIVDSPEAHLHPAGQSQMGRILAMIAAGGAQLVIETHSDHILNGIRLAVRDSLISCEDVSINFFVEQGTDTSPRITNPQLNSLGSLSEWPSGFFDQADLDISTLAGLI